MTFIVVSFRNGWFENATPFQDNREAHAFSRGLNAGAAYFRGDFFSTVFPLDPDGWSGDSWQYARTDYIENTVEGERRLAESAADRARITNEVTDRNGKNAKERMAALRLTSENKA